MRSAGSLGCALFSLPGPPGRPRVVEGAEGRTPRLVGQPQPDSCARLPGRGLTCAVPKVFQQRGGERHPGSGLRAATLARTRPRDPKCHRCGCGLAARWAQVSALPPAPWERLPASEPAAPLGAPLRMLCGGF